jgi:chromosome segregation ATPase
MWDLTLTYEVSLLAAIFALIAWFMGRSLCKSKEHQVRSHLTQMERENNRLESLLIKKDTDIQQAQNSTRYEQKKVAELEHQYAASESTYANLQKNHHEILKELQSSQACHVKYEELNKHHTEQAVEYLHLKELYQKTLIELQDISNTNKQQKIHLEKYKLDNEQLTQDRDEQSRTIASLQHSLENHQKLLQSREQSIHELTYQLGNVESQHKQLVINYDEQLKAHITLKKSWEQIQDTLQESLKTVEKYQQDLVKSNGIVNDLRNKVATYEILSTIG